MVTKALTYLADLDATAVLIYRPLPWQTAGLQETASGYGRKLRTSRCVRLSDGRIRRVYCTCFSNSGTCWIVLNGQDFVIVDSRIQEVSA